MTLTRSLSTLPLCAVLTLACAAMARGAQAPAGPAAAAQPLVVAGDLGEPLTLTLDQIRALPRTAVTVTYDAGRA
jgi:hypothetical protein